MDLSNHVYSICTYAHVTISRTTGMFPTTSLLIHTRSPSLPQNHGLVLAFAGGTKARPIPVEELVQRGAILSPSFCPCGEVRSRGQAFGPGPEEFELTTDESRNCRPRLRVPGDDLREGVSC